MKESTFTIPYAYERLNELIWNGWQEKEHLFTYPKLKEQLIYEMGLIREHDWSSKFYLMAYLAQQMRERHLCSYVRGTLACSLVAYVTGITDIMPITYGLDIRSLYGMDGAHEPEFELNIDGMETVEVIRMALTKLLGSKAFITCCREKDSMFTVPFLIFTTKIDSEEAENLWERYDVCGNGEIISIEELYELVDRGFFKFNVYENYVAKALTKLWNRTGVMPSSYDSHEEMNQGVLDYNDSWIEIAGAMKPETFDDYVDVYSLAHGTKVWEGNMKEVHLEYGIPLGQMITHGERICEILISHGVDDEIAFEIMEYIRKGRIHLESYKKRWLGYRTILRTYNLPEWFLDACEKLRYLFPKAHAVSYVVNYRRLNVYKQDYPEVYWECYRGE